MPDVFSVVDGLVRHSLKLIQEAVVHSGSRIQLIQNGRQRIVVHPAHQRALYASSWPGVPPIYTLPKACSYRDPSSAPSANGACNPA